MATSVGMKRLWATETYRKNWSRSRRRNKDTSRYSIASKRRWKDKKLRKRMCKAFKGVKRSQEACLIIRAGHRTLEARRSHSLGNLRRYRDPMERKKQARILEKAREFAPSGGPSRIQVSIFRSLCASGWKGVLLEKRVGPYSVDIAYKPRRLAFEIDGAYWHGKPNHRRDQYLRRCGWSVHHFPASKSSIRKVLNILEGRNETLSGNTVSSRPSEDALRIYSGH